MIQLRSGFIDALNCEKKDYFVKNIEGKYIEFQLDGDISVNLRGRHSGSPTDEYYPILVTNMSDYSAGAPHAGLYIAFVDGIDEILFDCTVSTAGGTICWKEVM